MGAVLGAAAITKFTIFPVVAVLFLLAIVPALRPVRDVRVRLRFVVDVVLAVVGFCVVSGWWFVRNHHLYGQYLATKASEEHLQPFFLGPIPWSEKLLLSIYPQTLLMYSWYDQARVRSAADDERDLGSPCDSLPSRGRVGDAAKASMGFEFPHASRRTAFLGCILGGLAAVLVIIKTNGRGDTRDAFLVVTSVALVVVAGSARIFSRFSPRLELVGVSLWPVLLLALDLYVLGSILIPFGGL